MHDLVFRNFVVHFPPHFSSFILWRLLVCIPELVSHVSAVQALHWDHELSWQFSASAKQCRDSSKLDGQAFPPHDGVVIIDLDRDCSHLMALHELQRDQWLTLQCTTEHDLRRRRHAFILWKATTKSKRKRISVFANESISQLLCAKDSEWALYSWRIWSSTLPQRSIISHDENKCRLYLFSSCEIMGWFPHSVWLINVQLSILHGSSSTLTPSNMFRWTLILASAECKLRPFVFKPLTIAMATKQEFTSLNLLFNKGNDFVRV